MEKEKVLVLFGSPRHNGNTRAIVDAFIEARNFEPEFIFVNQLNMKGCQGCLYCQAHGGECKPKDEMTPLYDKIKNAKKIIMAFPMFYASFPGEYKRMIDRLFAVSHMETDGKKNYYGSFWPKGRDIFVIVSHGNSIEEVYPSIVRSIRYMCIETNSTLKGWYFSPPCDFFDVKKDKSYLSDLLEAARDF